MTNTYKKSNSIITELNTIQKLTLKKPGPKPGPKTQKYNVLIEEDLGEWGKEQPGGLSELIRKLIKEERSRLSHK